MKNTLYDVLILTKYERRKGSEFQKKKNDAWKINAFQTQLVFTIHFMETEEKKPM